MAQNTLPALSHPNFPQVFEDAVDYEVRRVFEIVDRVLGQPVLNAPVPSTTPEFESRGEYFRSLTRN